MLWLLASLFLSADSTHPVLETEVIEHGLAEHDLATALLIASGETEPAGIARAADGLVETVRRLARATRQQNEAPAQLPNDLRVVMHRDLLRTYTPGAYDLRKTWERGEYDCLTATGLYLLVARELGLPAGAYAIGGHIQALAFTAAGPVYIETTAPGSLPSRTWNRPLEIALETSAETSRTRSPKPRKKLAGAAKARAAGADDATQTRAQELAARTFVQAARNADEIGQNAFEVDASMLVALHFWNRAVAAASRGDADQTLRFADAFSSLAPDPIRSHTVGLRLLEVEGVLGEQMRRHGWQSATATVAALLEVAPEPSEQLRLRDIRARLWAAAMRRATGTARCAIAAAALRADPDHPLVTVLRQRTASAGCTAQTGPR
jgi:hypothetical protein